MRKTVLIVDDVYANIYLVEGALAGYKVLNASNGDEMWNLIKNNKPDMIIMDIMLPEEDGISLAKKLHSNDDYKNIPIIFLTAKHSSKNDIIESVKAGGYDFIIKPFDPDELAARVDAVFERIKKSPGK